MRPAGFDILGACGRVYRRRWAIKFEEASQTGWLREAGRRTTSQLWLKAVGIPGFIALFFVAYFLLLDYPLFAVHVMPLTALDRWIGFQPWAFIPYFSLWVYVSLPPTLIAGRRELMSYLGAAAGLSLAAMLVYLFCPTATPAPGIDWAHYPAFEFLHSAGLARNACPSLHAAFTVFSAFWIGCLLREMRAPALLHAVNVLWCLLILYSTIATRQHVALDIYAGVALGFAGYAAHRWFAAGLPVSSRRPRALAFGLRKRLLGE